MTNREYELIIEKQKKKIEYLQNRQTLENTDVKSDLTKVKPINDINISDKQSKAKNELISALENRLIEQDKQIEELKDRSKDDLVSEKIEELANDIREYNYNITNLESSLKDKEEEIKRLETKLSEFEDKQDEIEDRETFLDDFDDLLSNADVLEELNKDRDNYYIQELYDHLLNVAGYIKSKLYLKTRETFKIQDQLWLEEDKKILKMSKKRVK